MSLDVDAMGRAIDAVQAILDPISNPYERLCAYADLLGRLEVLAPEAVLTACQAHRAFHCKPEQLVLNDLIPARDTTEPGR